MERIVSIPHRYARNEAAESDIVEWIRGFNSSQVRQKRQFTDTDAALFASFNSSQVRQKQVSDEDLGKALLRFNSSQVRQKLKRQTSRTLAASCFNSSQVRQKLELTCERVAADGVSIPHRYARNVMKCSQVGLSTCGFNSSQVRQKHLFLTSIRVFSQCFNSSQVRQKPSLDFGNMLRAGLFQFLIGTLETLLTPFCICWLVCFNSSQVRQKPSLLLRLLIVLHCFNSSQVRQKLQGGNVYSICTQLFQFLIGTLETWIPKSRRARR